MRVIAGRAKGRRLKVPKRVTRPSTDRLREALFSILGLRLEGARVMDLFAGSGALGIEALSRGAAAADFVESDSRAAGVIKENLALAGLDRSATVHALDVFKLLASWRADADLVFADPPYASNARDDLAERLLEDSSLPKLLRAEGMLMVEVESEREAPIGPAWQLLDRRVYGSSAILFYGLVEAE